ncbi:MAG TPA: phage major capsid protein [Mycobacterium sp.]|nr:phage major capsid protein [Mycobacterium sp.]
MTEIQERRDLMVPPAGGLEDFLDQLLKRRESTAENRARSQQKAEAVLLLAREQGREKLELEEDAEYRKYMGDMRTQGAEVIGLDERINEIRAEVERSGQIAKNLAGIRKAKDARIQVKEQLTYQKGDRRSSYVTDLVKMTCNLDGDGEARGRLMRHAQDVASDDSFKEYRDISRVDGQGGYAVPPAWLMDQYIELARPGRAFANLVQRQALPGGTDSINIPKLLTGTAVGVQTADNTAIAKVDLTDTFINAPVRTIAGAQGVSIQLIDQSPIAFDDVVFRDLVAAHAASTDTQVLAGSGTGGQVLGVNNTPGILTVAASAVTIQGVYSAIANAIQLVHTQRFLPPEVIVMHPVRWGWFLSLLDNQERPLFLPAANSPMNVGGVLSDVASQQVVGQMHGLPVVTDPNITTTAGGSPGNQDLIYVLRASDLVLWESGIRARVLPETLATNLTVLLQIYNYLAFSAGRYPQSVVEITGLTAPTF